MRIGKEDLVRINHGFGGSLRSDSSLDFAFSKIENKKLGLYKKLAYILRSIIVDHPFSDANKRTAMFYVFVISGEHKKKVDRDLLLHHIIEIARKNIQDVRKIERRLKNAIRWNKKNNEKV